MKTTQMTLDGAYRLVCGLPGSGQRPRKPAVGESENGGVAGRAPAIGAVMSYYVSNLFNAGAPAAVLGRWLDRYLFAVEFWSWTQVALHPEHLPGMPMVASARTSAGFLNQASCAVP